MSQTAVEVISNGAFSSNRVLMSVELPRGLKEIGDCAFSGCALLKTIDLSRQSLTILSGIVGGTLVTSNTSLTELNLHSNELGPDGMRTIVTRLGTACAQLNMLDLGNNVHAPGEKPLEKKGDKKGGAQVDVKLTDKQLKDLEDLTMHLGKLATLEKLHFDNNSLHELPSVGNSAGVATEGARVGLHPA